MSVDCPPRLSLNQIRDLENHLKNRIIGQEEAIPEIAKVIRISEQNLTSRREPKGCFFFLGSTGVGKTEVTKTFADYIFGKENFFRLDMSEFKHKDSIINFIGDHSGKVGRLGKILSIATEGVILFDEIEKAHPDIRDLFLQMYDDAAITVGDGVSYDLSRFYLVLTSNIGSKKIVHTNLVSFETIKNYVIQEVSNEFRPEFIRRFRNIVVFSKLTLDHQRIIGKQMVDMECRRLREERGISIAYTPETLNHFVDLGYDDLYGARNLRNIIQFHIRNAISDSYLNERDPNGTLHFNPLTLHFEIL